MEAHRRHQVVAEALGRAAERRQQLLQAGRAGPDSRCCAGSSGGCARRPDTTTPRGSPSKVNWFCRTWSGCEPCRRMAWRSPAPAARRCACGRRRPTTADPSRPGSPPRGAVDELPERRARPGRAAGTPGRCRCGRRPSCRDRRAASGSAALAASAPTTGRSVNLPYSLRVAEHELAERRDVAVVEDAASSGSVSWSQSIAGWLMPSAKPNGSTPSRSRRVEAAAARRTRRRTPRPVERGDEGVERVRGSRVKNITSTCGHAGRAAPSPARGRVGAVRRRAGARGSARPCRPGTPAKMPARTAGGTPSASRPAAVKATCSAVGGGGSTNSALVTGAWRSQARAAARFAHAAAPA